MSTFSPLVLLLKSASKEHDPYHSLLSQHGFTVQFLPVLDFTYINLDKLQSALVDSSLYGALVVTSPRALAAVEISLKLGLSESENVTSPWLSKKIFVVGEATAQAARDIGFTDICGEASGNAEALAEFILNDNDTKTMPLLFPCGNLKKETLPKALNEGDCDLRSVTVYKTNAHPDLKDNLQSLLNCYGRPQAIVYFSPSGVIFTDEIFKLHELHNSPHQVAIGPSTRVELDKRKHPVGCVCDKPSAAGLLTAVQQLFSE